jgi:hypothetical protein
MISYPHLHPYKLIYIESSLLLSRNCWFKPDAPHIQLPELHKILRIESREQLVIDLLHLNLGLTIVHLHCRWYISMNKQENDAGLF